MLISPESDGKISEITWFTSRFGRSLYLPSCIRGLFCGLFVLRRPNSIESVLIGKRRLVVEGQAGSGKTTLFQWLAVRAAREDFEAPLEGWNDSIPFFIRLREYAESTFPPPGKGFLRSLPLCS